MDDKNSVPTPEFIRCEDCTFYRIHTEGVSGTGIVCKRHAPVPRGYTDEGGRADHPIWPNPNMNSSGGCGDGVRLKDADSEYRTYYNNYS